MPPPRLIRCHYEVLEAPRDSDADFLKKQYRKMALKFHPDKNPGDPEGAKEAFQIIQQAYDVLSDVQERAWYDGHREEILRGGVGERLDEEGIDLFQYFSTSCFSGWGDDDGGFYGVFKEVFNTIASEDMDFMAEQEDDDFQVPSLGLSTDLHEDVGAAFYSYWAGYSTPRTFSWLDKYDTRQAENRWMRRKMEQENKVLRDAARKERNTVVRNLVAFVKKRDRRVVAYRRRLEERAEENKRKTKDFQIKQKQDRKKLFEEGEGSQGFGMAGLEEQLRQLESQFTDSEEEEQEGEQEEEELDLGGLEELYCVACDRLCKSMGAKENHETSKKHKDNMEKLILEMQGEEDEQEDDEESEADEEEEDGAEEEPEEIRCSPCGEVFKTEEAKAKHEASKKHRKNLKLNDKKKTVKEKEEVLGKVMDNDEEKAEKKKVKGKNRKKKLNDDSPGEIEEPVLTTTETHDSEGEKENVDNLDNGDKESVQQEIESPLQKKVQAGKKVKCPPDDDEGDEQPVKSSCAQCNATFPSKTKLHNHLKTTGHATIIGVADGGKKKKKSRK